MQDMSVRGDSVKIVYLSRNLTEPYTYLMKELIAMHVSVAAQRLRDYTKKYPPKISG